MADQLYAYHIGSRPTVGKNIWLEPGEVYPTGSATRRAEYVITKVTHEGDGAFMMDVRPARRTDDSDRA